MKTRGSVMLSDVRGLTLVETLASLLIFTIVTLGTVPLLISSLQGANLSRSETIAKNVAQKAVERARGLAYFRSFSTEDERVDILDLYFPGVVSQGANTSYAGGKYTTICPGAATPRACPPGLPSGYQVTFEAEFVKPGALDGNGNETFDVVVPPTSPAYAWNAANNLDQPPTQLLRLATRVSWTVGARARSLTLTSLIGDRKLGVDKVRGFARVDYVVSVITSFKDTSTLTSDLFAVGGIGDARVESRILSQADIFVRTADIKLIQNAVDPLPATEIDKYVGPTSIYRAPPDLNPGATAQDGLGDLVTHLTDPTIGNVAFADSSRTKVPLRVLVAAENPIAEGGFELDSEGTPGVDEGFWVDNQAAGTSGLLLDLVKPIFSVVFQGGAGTQRAFDGQVSAITGDVATDKRVQTIAQVNMRRAGLFPVDFGPGAHRGPIVRITSLNVKTDCKTAGTTAAFAAPTYSAGGFEYFKESNTNDGLTAGSFVPLTLSQTNVSDPLAALRKVAPVTGPLSSHPNDTNPMVYEKPADTNPNGHPEDIYLFPVVHDHRAVPTGDCIGIDCHSHPGYLDIWKSETSSSVFGLVKEGGREVAARVDGAITIRTNPTNPLYAGSAMVISLGKLSCEAVDNR